MIKKLALLALLASCTMTCISTRNHGGNTTVDASITSNPTVDPNVQVPLPKISYIPNSK